MLIQSVSRYLVVTIILTLAICQTVIAQNDPVAISKGKFFHSGVYTFQKTSTLSSCWKNVPRRFSNRHKKTFILATGANTGKLKKANQDARLFKIAMQKRFNVPEDQTCFLKNVYRAQFEQALLKLKRWVKKGDLVIIFFSGHGSFVDDDNGDEPDKYDDVLVTKDVEDERWPKRKEVVTDDRLVELVNRLPTQRILTFIDACFSGGMYMGPKNDVNQHTHAKFFRKGNLGPKKKPSFQFNSLRSSRRPANFAHIKGVVFAAAREDQKAWEDQRGGIFTTTFLQQLKRYRRASLKRIFKYTATEVRKSKRTKEFQHPEMKGNSRLANNL